MSDKEKLRADANLAFLPTDLTYELRMAISGHRADEFLSWGYQWTDKPHRLVFAACAEAEALAADNERLGRDYQIARDAHDALLVENERLRAALERIGYTKAGDVGATLSECISISRAALAAKPAPSGWRPIETAPKDGTQFLTWDSHYGIRVGRCVVRPDHDDWLSYMDAYKGSSKGGIRATHWMPLPPAPKKEEA